MVDLSGKTAVITGASRGIGADTARVFAQAGAKVVLVARNAGQIEELATEIGENAVACPCDVASYEDWQQVIAQAGDVDILVNNAGLIDPIGRITDTDPAAWSQLIDVNLKGIYYGTRVVLDSMVKRGGGTIINVSSGAAHNALEGWSAYCASKAGAAMFTRATHLEYGDHGIRVMGMSPGTVATDMQVNIKASGINPVAALDPSVHIPAEWPARAMLWMCGSDADGYLGQEISLRDEAIRAHVGLSG